MPGRHASSRRRPSRPRRLAVGVVAVALVVAGAVGANAFLSDRSRRCEQAAPLEVVADPAIAPTLSQIADGYSDPAPAVNGLCIGVEVTPRASAEVAVGLGDDVTADLWVPDSSVWTRQVTAGAGTVTAGESVASSPLVVVAPRVAGGQN